MATVFILSVLNLILFGLIVYVFTSNFREKQIICILLGIVFLATFNMLLKESRHLDEQLQKERLLNHLERIVK